MRTYRVSDLLARNREEPAGRDDVTGQQLRGVSRTGTRHHAKAPLMPATSPTATETVLTRRDLRRL